MLARLVPSFALACLLAAGPLAPGAAEAETRQGEGYVLVVVAPAMCKAGATSTATVKLRPRGAWKLNAAYPFKLELTPAPGVRVAKAVLGKADARRFAADGADVDVLLTADKAGRADVAATVKFATCDEASCAVHKETFTISATAQ